VEAAAFPRVSKVHVHWDQGPLERVEPTQGGLLVDRGRFDQMLMEHAAAEGARVLQPATLGPHHRDADGWAGVIEARHRTRAFHARFLVDATGRAGALPTERRRFGPRTLALYAYWRGRVPSEPRLEAGANGWCWGVPIPDGTYNTLVFVDPREVPKGKPAVERYFHELLANSGLHHDVSSAELVTCVRAADASAYVAGDTATHRSLKVGDAGLAIDPLSSSGVQRAIQTSLAGAIVTNTLLRKPESAADAMSFYRSSLSEAAERHHRWATSYYAAAAETRSGPFWCERARDTEGAEPTAPVRDPVSAQAIAGMGVSVSPEATYSHLPCIEGDFVSVKEAVRHPGLDGPLAFLGGIDVAPLLRGWSSGTTPLEAARSWSASVPLESGIALASWLLQRGVLVASGPGDLTGSIGS
jgi:hypothetical protein